MTLGGSTGWRKLRFQKDCGLCAFGEAESFLIDVTWRGPPGEGPVCWCESPVGTPVGGPPAWGATLVFFQNIPHFLKCIVGYVFGLDSAGPLLLHGLSPGGGERGLLTAAAPLGAEHGL